MMSDWEASVYIKSNGRSPFKEWLYKLDAQQAAVVNTRIMRIISDGHFGECPPLPGNFPDLYELKIKQHGGIRVYLIKEQKFIVILLSGGVKNNKKEQSKDIAKAKEYYTDYKQNGAAEKYA
jgi:putative addiction module killer protein